MKSIHEQVTLNHLIDIYRGSSAKRIAQFQILDGAGKGKGLAKGDVERLLQHMCVKQVLKEYLVSNKMGFVSSYIKIGPSARALETGQLKIILMTTSDEPSSIKPSVIPVSSAAKPKATPSTSGSTVWPARKRKSLDSNLPAEVPQAVAATTKVSRVKKATDAEDTAKFSNARPVAQQAVDQMNIDCFDELMGKRSEICAKENIQCHHFLSNAAISEISKKLPKTIESLRAVKGLEERQINRFGALIVDICSKHS